MITEWALAEVGGEIRVYVSSFTGLWVMMLLNYTSKMKGAYSKYLITVLEIKSMYD